MIESGYDIKTDQRLRVVFVLGGFPDDADYLRTLGQYVSLVVYGTRFKIDKYSGTGDVRAVASAKPPQAVDSREFVPLMQSRRGHLFWLYPGFAGALDLDRPDIVHVVSEPWGILPFQAARWARRHPKSALLIHGCDRIWWHGSFLEQAVRRRMSVVTLSRTDGYAAESGQAIRRAQEVCLPRETPTAIIHTNPRSSFLFSPPLDAADRKAARLRLGLPPGGIACGFIGNLIERKGPLTFLEALSGVNGSAGDVWGAIAGRGSLEDRVRAEAQASGAVFLGGLQFPDHVRDFFRSMDVICVPSETTGDWDEQSPRVVIEAMLSGCSVVASDCGAIREMLRDDGILVPERNPAELRRGILRAVAAIRAGKKIGIHASARAEALYSGEAVAGQLIDLWSRSLERSQRAKAS